MPLEEHQIDDNQYIRRDNRRSVERLVGNMVGKPYLLTEVVRPWNPGFFLGCEVETKVRPVKDSGSIDGHGRYIFETRGDERLDFNPQTGNVDIGVHVSFNPLSLHSNPFSFSFRSIVKELSVETLGETMNGKNLYGFSLQSLPHFESHKHRKDLEFREFQHWYGKLFNDENAARVMYTTMMKKELALSDALEEYIKTSEFNRISKKATKESKAILDAMVNCEIMMSVRGIYSAYNEPKGFEAVAESGLSAFGMSRARPYGNIIHAQMIGLDTQLNDTLNQLKGPRYKVNGSSD